MRRLVLFFFLVFLLTPQVSLAVDSRCWTAPACYKARKGADVLNPNEPLEYYKEMFIQTPATIKACGGAKDAAGTLVGFCLPETIAKTKTTFGSQNEFIGLSEFIPVIYRYAILAAGVLALIMIIAAGFIWTTSGGNAERIGAAKKRIAGAMTGLLLAVLSYTILNTVNPNLVNIRMPQVYMINTLGITPPYCSEAAASTKFKLLGPWNLPQEQKDAKKNALNLQTVYDITDPKQTLCGNEYFVENTGGLSCTGVSCEGQSGNLCFGPDQDSDLNKTTNWRCLSTNLILSFRLTGWMTESLASLDGAKALLETVEDRWVDYNDPIQNDNSDADNPEIHPICLGQNGKLYTGDDEDIIPTQVIITHGQKIFDKSILDYDFIFPKVDVTRSSWCPNNANDTLKGFFIMMEVKESGDNTDPDLWIGQSSPKESNPKDAKIGAWLKKDQKGVRIHYTDYIPVENFEKGIIMEVSVTDEVFQTVEDFTGSKNRIPSTEDLARTEDPYYKE